ncbi:MAG: helix-turn-helix domain-containing protein [Bryobacteraceae bacterium]
MGDSLVAPSAQPGLLRARDYLAARFNERVSLTGCRRPGRPFPVLLPAPVRGRVPETPHEFVTRLRIDHAKKLLLAGNHSVTDVCFDAGYENLGSFSTRFRTLTGLAPAEFRRESRRVFGTSGRCWPLYYMPVCFRHFFAGIH